LDGTPFREAYKIVGEQIENGDFVPQKKVNHTHEGSIGNLFLPSIADYKKSIIKKFNFDKVDSAIERLLLSCN